MRVLICGLDGYLGWSLALYLMSRGHKVAGLDNFARREWVAEMGSQSATPIRRMTDRLLAFRRIYGREIIFRLGDLIDYKFVHGYLTNFEPEAIVHLAEQASAPFSMIDVEHATFTQQNNIIGTLNLVFAMNKVCPEAHLVKLGTMGEYGTPNIDIPEGFFEIEYRGRKDVLPFPRQAGSWYHQSKVHDTNNIMMACKIWGLRSTDIMQGVVFGTRVDEMSDESLLTRFDFDQCFGTAINRFCSMAVIGHPLTVYGKGTQTRGYLPLRDSIQCLTLAIENPPKKGEYRVFNQFQEVYTLNDLASKVQEVGKGLGLNVEIRHTENPRMEKEEHYYKPDHKHLFDLGYKPTKDIQGEMAIMMKDLVHFRSRIEERADALIPNVRWDGTRKKVCFLG
jgi:UDP-sulfoquinovose synthase